MTRARVVKAIRALAYRDVPKHARRKTRHIRDPKTGVIYATDERRVYQDAMKPALAAFIEDADLSEKEIDDIQKILKQKRKG